MQFCIKRKIRVVYELYLNIDSSNKTFSFSVKKNIYNNAQNTIAETEFTTTP